jgi:hypothetical protein
VSKGLTSMETLQMNYFRTGIETLLVITLFNKFVYYSIIDISSCSCSSDVPFI